MAVTGPTNVATWVQGKDTAELTGGDRGNPAQFPAQVTEDGHHELER